MGKGKLAGLIGIGIVITVIAIIGLKRSFNSSSDTSSDAAKDTATDKAIDKAVTDPNATPTPDAGAEPSTDSAGTDVTTAPSASDPNSETAAGAGTSPGVVSTPDAASTDASSTTEKHSSTTATGSSTGPSTPTAMISPGDSALQGKSKITTPEFADDEAKTHKKDTNKPDTKKEAAKSVEILSNCFSAEYQHTSKMANQDIEDFLDYSNAFPVAKDTNLKTVCVKVNGKPVQHKIVENKGAKEAWIGSVVGPTSVIKVSYCIGKAQCGEPCTIATKRFMDDVMSDGDDSEFKDSAELKAQVKELRTAASQSAELSRQSVMRTWDSKKQQDWVCKKTK
jgi:hypothetical protein